ncbi:MAG TPA: hypothetical protein VF623_13800 [Segetibacter sp.]|jgi:hypothetical protein
MIRLLLIAGLFKVSCHSADTATTPYTNTGTDTITDTTYIATTPFPIGGCYAYAVNKDSATMKLAVDGNNVTGDLAYNFSEKDRNRGTLQGIIKDNLVVADYTFQSEGITSVRQVVFKIDGTTLIEGFGDIETRRDTVSFKNIDKLRFRNDHSFKEVDCK